MICARKIFNMIIVVKSFVYFRFDKNKISNKSKIVQMKNPDKLIIRKRMVMVGKESISENT